MMIYIGLIIPRNSLLYFSSIKIFETFVHLFLLPLYFAMSGLQTDFTTLHVYPDVVILIAICLIATMGKFIGAGVASYLCKIPKRESAVIAVLMNTRGLVELIVLNIGLREGVLNNRIFSVMVIMCLLTTFMTCPLILWIYPSSVRVNYIAHTDELNDQYHDHEISHKVHYEDASIRMVEVNKDLISTSKIEETKYDNDVVGESA
jgi:Kef-type K+ transport system membrane component KefB